MANTIGANEQIVLFPTSDRIAKSIGADWPALQERFLLSWSHCRELVLELQGKDQLARHCKRAGVPHPRSRVLHHPDSYDEAVTGLHFPLVVKPAQPLSSFKAIKIGNVSDLRRCTKLFPRDLPFVVQEWIDGPEPSLYSYTTYLDRGRPLFHFTSRKIAACPPGTGQGTVFETTADEEVATLATRFLGTLDLSGPVAVEFKRDSAGTLWLIEPNVGRTEYCVDLAIQSGFNLPYIEYLHVTGRDTEAAKISGPRNCVWYDTDKDPLCFLKNLRVLRSPDGHWRHAVFPFIGHSDWRPLVASLIEVAGETAKASGRFVARRLGVKQR